MIIIWPELFWAAGLFLMIASFSHLAHLKTEEKIFGIPTYIAVTFFIGFALYFFGWLLSNPAFR